MAKEVIWDARGNRVEGRQQAARVGTPAPVNYSRRTCSGTRQQTGRL